MNHLTKCSVFIELYLFENSDTRAAIGTGFTVKTNNGDNFLITNWHCVTGRNPETNEQLSTNGVVDPERMDIHFLKRGSLNEWMIKTIRLRDENGRIFYIEHPKGQEIDVVAIKLENYIDIDIYNLWEGNIVDNIDMDITDTCSIVGFPKGISTAGKFPIWKIGHIASEFELNHDNKPMFLIDASTREGMSGSPVYCVRNKFASIGGEMMTGTDSISRFLGVYAGRVGNDIEIGRVFKAECIEQILINYYNNINPYRFTGNNLNYNMR